MAAELAWLALRGQWALAVPVLALMTLFALPVLVKRPPVEIPSEIQLVAALFIFATIFLGEIQGYYERFWWWDAALHTGSGALLGLFGFLIVYMLNEDALVDLHMRPAFLALFAFFFAVGIGALWEIFEFAMDELAGTNMQPATPGDPSGLTDTMWDLIVDTLGAAAAAVAGWLYLRRPHRHRIDGWMSRFIARNPRMFGD